MIRLALKVDQYTLEITTNEGKTIRILPTCAYLLKNPQNDNSLDEWYGRFIDEIPKLGEEYMGLFIDCGFSPSAFIKQIKERGGKVRFIEN